MFHLKLYILEFINYAGREQVRKIAAWHHMFLLQPALKKLRKLKKKKKNGFRLGSAQRVKNWVQLNAI